MKRKTKLIWGFILSTLLISGFYLFIYLSPAEDYLSKKDNKLAMKLADKIIFVSVASTPGERYQGLSGMEKLKENEGKLFIHQRLAKHQYVMRGMMFDLDFIFIKDNQVVDIIEKIPKEFKGIIQGKKRYNKILEMPSGWVKKNKVKVGDKINLPKKGRMWYNLKK